MSVFRVAGLLLCLVLLAMGQGFAQARAYSLDQVITLVKAGVSTSVILDRVRTTCIGFGMDAETERRLTESGADQALVDGLRTVCRPTESAQRVESATPREGAPTVEASKGPSSVTSRQQDSTRADQGAAVPPSIQPNPWGGFRIRALGYGATTAVGAFLAMKESEPREVCEAGDCWNVTVKKNEKLGLGLVVAAAAAGVLDMTMTSRKAKALQTTYAATAGVQPRERISLRLPELTLTTDEMRINLIRMSF